jgi:hypothetical protein
MAQVILKNVRLSYPDLFKPGKPMNDGDVPKYGGQFIFDADSEAAKVAKQALIQAAQETFGANWQAIVNAMEKSKKCVRKGDDNLTKDGAIRDGYGGKLYVVARNKAKPLLIGPRRGPDGQFPVLTEDGGKPYGGCYVNVKVDIKAMKAKDKIPNQIYATLLTVQFVADGEAFGAAPGTSDGFDDVEGAEMGSGFSDMDDDIPF